MMPLCGVIFTPQQSSSRSSELDAPRQLPMAVTNKRRQVAGLTHRSARMEGITHMSPVVNADTPVPIRKVFQAKSPMCFPSSDRQKQD